LAKENKFNSLERPKNMLLTKEPFTAENGLLTPSFKLKRNIAKEMYGNDINRMYEEGVVLKGKR